MSRLPGYVPSHRRRLHRQLLSSEREAFVGGVLTLERCACGAVRALVKLNACRDELRTGWSAPCSVPSPAAGGQHEGTPG